MSSAETLLNGAIANNMQSTKNTAFWMPPNSLDFIPITSLVALTY